MTFKFKLRFTNVSSYRFVYDVKCLPVPKYIENYANVKNA